MPLAVENLWFSRWRLSTRRVGDARAPGTARMWVLRPEQLGQPVGRKEKDDDAVRKPLDLDDLRQGCDGERADVTSVPAVLKERLVASLTEKKDDIAHVILDEGKERAQPGPRLNAVGSRVALPPPARQPHPPAPAPPACPPYPPPQP